MKQINNNRGSAAGFLILFMAVFIVILFICVEWYHAAELRNYLENELSRALKLAVGLSMKDEYRKDHISRIDSKAAEREFEKYLHEVMMLDEDNKRVIGNETVYKIQIDYIHIIEEPPSIEIKGCIKKPLLLFGFSNEIVIPCSLKIANKRLEVET